MAALARGFSDRNFERGEGPGDEVALLFAYFIYMRKRKVIQIFIQSDRVLREGNDLQAPHPTFQEAAFWESKFPRQLIFTFLPSDESLDPIYHVSCSFICRLICQVMIYPQGCHPRLPPYVLWLLMKIPGYGRRS